MDKEQLVQELIKLEPVFMKAGDLALERQKTAISFNKFNTGQADFDIFTKADLEVQEFILKAMAKTPLTECYLLAEEDTPTVSSFKKTGNLYLTLDPIDGTSLYAKGKKYWKLIVSLHDEKDILYTYDYYPVAKWANKIVGKSYESIGEKPRVKLRKDGSKTIVYSYGTTDVIKKELYSRLIKQGYNFKLRKELTDESGSTTLLQTGQVAGYFNSKPIVYDSLVSLHFAQAKGYKIYNFGTSPNGELDLTDIKDDHGFIYHPGYYIVLERAQIERVDLRGLGNLYFPEYHDRVIWENSCIDCEYVLRYPMKKESAKEIGG